MSANCPASAHAPNGSRQRSGGPLPASPSANVRGVTPSPAAAQATPMSAPAHARNDSRQRSAGPLPASPSANVRGVMPSPAAAALQTQSSASSVSVAPGPHHPPPPPPSPTAPAPGASQPAAFHLRAFQPHASQLGASQLGASQPHASQPPPAPAPPAPPPYAPPNSNWVHVRANPADALPDILVPDPGDPARPFNYRSVTCLPEYAHVSFEELRSVWYAQEGRLKQQQPLPQSQQTQPQQALQQPPQRFQLPPQRFQLPQQPPQPSQHYHWDTVEGQRLWQHASTGSAASIPTLPSRPAQPPQAQQQQQPLPQQPTQSQQVLQRQPQPFQQLQQPFQHPFQQPQQPQQPQQNYHGNTPEGQRLWQPVASNGSAASIATLPSQPVQPPTPNRLQYLAPNGIASISTLVSSPVQPPQPVQPPASVGLVILPSGNVCTLADIVEIQKQVMEGLELLREPARADQEAEAADSDDDERSPSPRPRRKHRHRDKQSSDKLRHRVKRIEKMLDRLLLESETTDTPSPSLKEEAAPTSAPPEDKPAPLLREAVPREQNLEDESSKAPTRDDVFSLIALHGEPLASEHDEPPIRPRDPSSTSSTFASIIEFTRCPEVRQFLKRAARFPGLRSTRLFNFPWVLDNLFDVHGGILMHWLDQSLDLMQTLVSSDSSLGIWDASLLRKIDTVYCDTLRPAIGHDGRPDDELKAAWKTYRHGVLQCLNDHAPPFDAARARALLPAEAEPFVVPILTASFVHDFNDMWCSVDVALKEIARWFEPFIDYGPDYHRRQPFHDATLTIARHIRADTALADPEQAVTLLWTFLRRERACFLAVLRAKMQHAAAPHAALRSQPVLPAHDAHPTLRSLLASPPALAAAMELRALDATRWTWADADWGVRLAGALREAALVRAYRPALLRIPQVEYIRGAVLAACQRSAFWDGLEAGDES